MFLVGLVTMVVRVDAVIPAVRPEYYEVAELQIASTLKRIPVDEPSEEKKVVCLGTKALPFSGRKARVGGNDMHLFPWRDVQTGEFLFGRFLHPSKRPLVALRKNVGPRPLNEASCRRLTPVLCEHGYVCAGAVDEESRLHVRLARHVCAQLTFGSLGRDGDGRQSSVSALTGGSGRLSRFAEGKQNANNGAETNEEPTACNINSPFGPKSLLLLSPEIFNFAAFAALFGLIVPGFFLGLFFHELVEQPAERRVRKWYWLLLSVGSGWGLLWLFGLLTRCSMGP